MEFHRLDYGVERMSEEFTKYHLHTHLTPWPFMPVFHHFTGPDKGGPHCHPRSFTTHILAGCYVERRYQILGPANWSTTEYVRRAGEAIYVPANTIHEIIQLPEAECWTLNLAGPVERESFFWRFASDGIARRRNNETEYIRIAP